MRPTLIAVLMCGVVLGQETPPADKNGAKQPGAEKVKQGFPLEGVVTVQGNASVEAILIPPSVTRGLFGKAVSDRYVAVQVIIANRSRDHTLIVHDVFIDYSRWLFSGSSGDVDAARCEKADTDPASERFPDCGNRLEPWQVQTKRNQIASVEYRLARGTLFDSQPFTVRNLMIRGLEAAGSIAAGYAFAFRETGIAKGIAAYNGNFLPAARYFMPDRTVEQANRISDYGFRVNRVVAENSSEMMVAFFPIDRFIPPSMKKLFEKSPALFFVPHALVLDPEAQAALKPALDVFDVNVKQLAASIRKSFHDKQADENMKFLNRLSLNTVRMVVSGSMVVDAQSVPASIESVEFDGGNASLDLWQGEGEKRGTIAGRNLGGGTPIVLEADRLGITGIASIEEGSTDTALRFKATFTKPIPSGEKLVFRVDKRDKNNKIIEGANRYELPVNYVAQPPSIDKADVSGSTLTIAGKRMFSAGRTVRLHPSAVAGLSPVTVATFISQSPTELKIDVASLDLKPACWTPEVGVNTMFARAASSFAKEPNPKIEAAKKSGSRVVVTGKDFISLDQCGKTLTFEVIEDRAGAESRSAANLKIVSATEASFDFPAVPANTKWKVRVLLNKVQQDIADIQ